MNLVEICLLSMVGIYFKVFVISKIGICVILILLNGSRLNDMD